VLVRSCGKEGRLANQCLPCGVQLTDLVFQVLNSLGDRFLAAGRSGCEEFHRERVGAKWRQVAGISGLDALDWMEHGSLRKPVAPIRENTRRAGVEGAQRTRLPVRRRDCAAPRMPKCKESNCKRIGVLGEEHPCAVWPRRDPIAQASDVSPERVPRDRLVCPRSVIPITGNFAGRVAVLLEEVAERAHLTRLSATNAARLRTDSKTR